MPNVYDIGQEVRYYGTFQDTGGTAYDPGTVNLLFIPPGQGGTYFSWTGVNGSITKQSVGTFYFDYRHVAGGYTVYGWEGTGTINVATYDRDFIRYMGTNA
jgi:hypothetical protein